jgi:hypothetical protein
VGARDRDLAARRRLRRRRRAAAEKLDELKPSKRRLAAVYDVPSGGEAMLDFLRIFRLAGREGDGRNVVIIPIQH